MIWTLLDRLFDQFAPYRRFVRQFPPELRPAAKRGWATGALFVLAVSFYALTWVSALQLRTGEASRNSSGTYSLPTGNPVQTGTKITSVWANNTCTDIGTELTNSLDRNGRGPMLAPLILVNGTSSAPATGFTSEAGTGPYRNGLNDIRYRVNGVGGLDAWKAQSVNPAFSTANGYSATQAAVNGNAIAATGNGTGAGVNAVGGSTSGTGVIGAGGSTNGVGVAGTGIGSGAGVTGAGGTSGNGVTGTGGATSGNGGVFTGGGGSSNGVVGFGGTPNGIGVSGVGTGTGVGGDFQNGTAATASTRQDAVVVENGDVRFDGIAKPNATVAIKNRQTVGNLIAAWVQVATNPCSVATTGGYNYTSCSCAGSKVTIQLAQALASTSGMAVLADVSSNAADAEIAQANITDSTHVVLRVITSNTGVLVDLCANARGISLLIVGPH